MNLMMSTRQGDGVTVVDMKGRILLGEEGAALRDLVFDLLKEGHRKILFSLPGVDYIDSSGLGHLISAFASVRKKAGRFKAAQPQNECL